MTSKESPNDLDVLLVMATDFDLEQVPTDRRALFNYAQAKIRFNADVFWTKVSIGQDTLDLWLNTYQLGKDLKRRGIVEVVTS